MGEQQQSAGDNTRWDAELFKRQTVIDAPTMPGIPQVFIKWQRPANQKSFALWQWPAHKKSDGQAEDKQSQAGQPSGQS